MVADGAFTTDALTALLGRLAIERAGSLGPTEITQAQVDLLLARIGALTEALRDAASNDSTRLAARLLIADLALVAGQFRGSTNAMRASLSVTLDELKRALAQSDPSGRPGGPT